MNILLVEDNPDDEALAVRALKKNDMAKGLVIARDGVEALDYLHGTGPHQDRDTSVQPSLVLLDLKLPRMNGFDVLKRMRADDRTRLLPVVVLTSSDEEQDLLDGYSLGANSYIRKPLDFREFTQTIAQLGQYWLKTNLPPPSNERGGD